MPETSNIYVGNRYVPFPQGTWDESQTYYPLDMVKYQGNVYINPGPGDIAPGTTPSPNDSPWWHMYAVEGDTPAPVGGGAWHSAEEFGMKPGTNISDIINNFKTNYPDIENIAFPQGKYFVSQGITDFPVSVMMAPGASFEQGTTPGAKATLRFEKNGFFPGREQFVGPNIIVDNWPMNIAAVKSSWFTVWTDVWNSAIPAAGSNLDRTLPVILETGLSSVSALPSGRKDNAPVVLRGEHEIPSATVPRTLTMSQRNPLTFENLIFTRTNNPVLDVTLTAGTVPSVTFKNCKFNNSGPIIRVSSLSSYPGKIDLTIEDCTFGANAYVFAYESASPNSFNWSNKTLPASSVPLIVDDTYTEQVIFNIKGNWTNVNVDPGNHKTSPALNLQGTYSNCIFNVNNPTVSPTTFTLGGYVETGATYNAGLLFSHCDMTVSAFANTIPSKLTPAQVDSWFSTDLNTPGPLSPVWPGWITVNDYPIVGYSQATSASPDYLQGPINYRYTPGTFELSQLVLNGSYDLLSTTISAYVINSSHVASARTITFSKNENTNTWVGTFNTTAALQIAAAVTFTLRIRRGNNIIDYPYIIYCCH